MSVYPAEPRHSEHSVAGRERGHAFAHGIDHARDFVADDARRLGGIGIEPDPGHEVGGN